MIDWMPFHGLLTDLHATLTFILIFLLLFFFTSQLFAWLTPPNPKPLHALTLGVGAGALGMFVIYNYVPLAPALINAAIVGVYGYPGYAWILSLMFLVLVFVVNTWNAWKEDRPLEVIQ